MQLLSKMQCCLAKRSNIHKWTGRYRPGRPICNLIIKNVSRLWETNHSTILDYLVLQKSTIVQTYSSHFYHLWIAQYFFLNKPLRCRIFSNFSRNRVINFLHKVTWNSSVPVAWASRQTYITEYDNCNQMSECNIYQCRMMTTIKNKMP